MSGDLLLRPHHSLCIRFFIGEGYSEAFVRHMRSMIAMLEADDPYVTLHGGCDILCAACPKMQGGVCTDDDKVSAIDRRVLSDIGLRYGDSVRWSALHRLSYERIIRLDRLKPTCADCRWRPICDRLSVKD